jgi:16S rRNA (guanine527-N7)-methyltransferase
VTLSLAATIAAECDRLGLDVSPEALPRLASYAERLWAWNEKLNLTRHADAATFVARDVADVVAIAPHLAKGERVLDVGTGGGVPGIVLAILRPDLHVELCDSVGKKARAVRAIGEEIGMPLPVHEAAGQAVVTKRPGAFDTLVIRAVAPLLKLLGWFEPVCHTYGRLLVIKGPRWEEEKGEARHRGFLKKVRIRRLAAWPIPGSDNESVLLEIQPRQER